MTRQIILLISAVAFIAGASGNFAHGFPANPDFENDAKAWTLPDGVTVAPHEGATGNALHLSEGWALTDPSDLEQAGWHRLTVRARVADGEKTDRLLLTLCGPDDMPSARAGVPVETMGSRWREIVAELPAPGGPVRIGIGTEGAATWLIDSVHLTPVELSVAQETDDAPVFEPPLPVDWEPDGLLDAVERQIGRGRELIINVGSLRISLPPEVNARRGHRGALRLSVTNSASSARELSVSVAGPPGFFAPRRTVNIRPDGETVFSASLQSFFVGQRAARVTFFSGEEEASAPVLVEVEPSYPATGLSFTGEQPSEADLATIRNLDLQLVSIRTSLEQIRESTGLPSHLARVLLLTPPWSGEELRSAAPVLPQHANFAALYHARDQSPAEAGRELTADLRHALDDVDRPLHLLSPPIDLPADPAETIEERAQATASELAAGGAIASTAVRLPVVQSRAAGTLTVDGRRVSVPQPAWREIGFEAQLSAAVRRLRESAQLPIFFADIAGRSAGCEVADAMTLARLLAQCAYRGATGFALSARPTDAPDGADAFCVLDGRGQPNELITRVVAELSRELAAVVPVRSYQQSEDIGLGADVAVGYRPFLRGDEGVAALWNNTAAPVDLIVELRTEPLDVHEVSVGLDGVHRSYRGMFFFSEDAIALNRRVMFVTLEPHEFRLMSMQLARPHSTWLAAVERKPQIPEITDRTRRVFEDWERRFAR